MRIPVIGGGPAGLMAADILLREGFAVDVYDAMPSLGRKFLMAGKSGLNITHTGDAESFLAHYPEADPRLVASIKAFGGDQVVAFMKDLGISARVGSTGRIFPEMMKASPLLRAWMGNLAARGARFYTRHLWSGWDTDDQHVFQAQEPARLSARPDVASPALFALGGASWQRLGSTGRWASHFEKRGVEIKPFQPSNCGFLTPWSDHMLERFEGEPVKSVALSFGNQTSRGEFVITRRGVESGGIYALSSALRDQIVQRGDAVLHVDLFPDRSVQDLTRALSAPRGKQSLANYLRKNVRLSPIKIALFRELAPQADSSSPEDLAATLKALPLGLTGMAPIDEAISTVGGIAWAALNDDFMLHALPGQFCAGEMIDWDAPTGGYLLTACLATGRSAGLGLAKWLRAQR